MPVPGPMLVPTRTVTGHAARTSRGAFDPGLYRIRGKLRKDATSRLLFRCTVIL
jgi:hypothetical protein